MNVKPMFDYLVVESTESKEVSKSGFILANASNEYVTAKVIAVGLGGTSYGKELKMYVKEGDTILYPKNYENKIKVNGKEVTFVRQENVIAIID